MSPTSQDEPPPEPLESREQLTLPLWEGLQVAINTPQSADLHQLLNLLEVTVSDLDTVRQLQVAAQALGQIVEVFCSRSTLLFEELEATASEEGPVMPTDAFDGYVRQIMEVDFERFIEPLASLPYKVPERAPANAASGSVVGELDQAALLQALDEQLEQHPQLSEAEVFNQALNVAYEEDIGDWSAAVGQYLQSRWASLRGRGQVKAGGIPLLELPAAVGLPLSKVWLSLLLGEGGGRLVQESEDFYDPAGVRVLLDGEVKE